MTYTNTLSFPLAADRVTHYSTGQNAVFAKLFDTTNNLMVLTIYPKDYTIISRSLGSNDVIEGAGNTLVQTPVFRTEASVKVQNGMAVIAAVLNELRDAAISDSTYKITVHDGCHVEFGDRAQGYTVREWWLASPVVAESVNARTGGSSDEIIYSGYTLDFVAF